MSKEDRLLFSAQRHLMKLDAERAGLRRAQQRSTFKRDANAKTYAQKLASIDHDRKLLRNIMATAALERDTFLFSSWTLLETFHHCCADDNEGLCVVAGCDVMHVRAGTHVIPLECEERNPVFAQAMQDEISQVAFEIANAGHRMVAIIHSHPGTGPQANHHSATDARTQRAWEATTKIVSGIWSRDGYLRFFTVEKPYEVVVVGTGVEQVEPAFFRFEAE